MCIRCSISYTCVQDTRLSRCTCKLLTAVRTKKFREGRWTALFKGTTRDKQNRQCNCSVTLRYLRLTIVAVGKKLQFLIL